MKLKSLLFGSAAAVVAVTGAQAADLPIAEPVEYVAICDAYGAGYFFIPGGDTCLKIGGTVLADAVYVNEDGIYEAEALVAGDNFNEFGTRVRGQVNFDARTSTEWGVLRSYINLRGEVDTRPERGTNPGGGTGVFNAADAFEINEAFLQLQMDAGIVTAGHTSSAFDFIGSEVFNILSYIDDTSGENNNLSYQAVFGSFTAVVSVEDTFAGAHGRMDTFAVAGSDEGFDVGGTEFPDLVGALQFEQAWGGAQLSGAVGQVSDITEGEELGWAVAFGARVGFGMFSAAGQATYTDGLIGYATNGRAEGLFEADDADSDGPGDLDTNTAWNLKGNVRAGITDAFYAEVSASYTEYNDEDGPDDGEVWGVVGNVGYTLVPGLLLGAEVGYQDVNNHGGNPDGDRWGVAGRVQRSF